jgi:uncharacterized lipoprotein YmbA
MDGSARLVVGRSSPGAPGATEPLLVAELLLAEPAAAGAPHYLLFADVSRIRLHPLHSRLCASVAPVSAHLDPADSLRQAASTCLSASATQMLWASSVSKGGRPALAFSLAKLGSAIGAAATDSATASATHVVTVSVMDMRGRMEQVAFAAKAAAAPVEGGAAAQPVIVAAAA